VQTRIILQILSSFQRQKSRLPKSVPKSEQRVSLSVGTWAIEKLETGEAPKPQVDEFDDVRRRPRTLTPATLGQLLRAELDHFVKVEQDIAAVAEVETNLEAAHHEHKLYQAMVLDDDSEELAELMRLDAEIARLEVILQQKMEYSVSDSA
jgi:hypothetical protein